MNIATVISARVNSSRLPGKVLYELGGVTMIEFLINRLKKSRLCNQFFLATSINPENDALAEIAQKNNISVFRGSEDDVVGRHIELAEKYKLDYIVRVTGDCPFVDFFSLDYCLEQIKNIKNFYLFTTKGNFPKGIDYELFSIKILKKEKKNMNLSEKEHLTLTLYNKKYASKLYKFNKPKNWIDNNLNYTIDTPEDYLKAKKIVEKFNSNFFSIEDLLTIKQGEL